MTNRRVVVTGIGAITPIGNNLKDYWASLIKGESGAAPITLFDATHFKTNFACEVKDFVPTDFIDRKEARKLDRFCQFAVVVADQAFSDSGLAIEKINSTVNSVFKYLPKSSTKLLIKVPLLTVMLNTILFSARLLS